MAHRRWLIAVEQEAARADARYGPFTSSHEGLGVLAEEYAELVEAVRRYDGTPNTLEAVRKEAMQVSAVALRIAASMDYDDTQARSRF